MMMEAAFFYGFGVVVAGPHREPMRFAQGRLRESDQATFTRIPYYALTR